jgi:hypothetical protein
MNNNNPTTQQALPSFTRHYGTFMAMVKAFESGEQLECCECYATAVRLFYTHTTNGQFLLGAALCVEHHREACQTVEKLTHRPVREIRSLTEASAN